MKKLTYILSAMTLVVAVALSFSGCRFAEKKAEKRLVENGEFVSVSDNHKYKDTVLSVREDKTYTLKIYCYETNAIETFEGTWSYVLTYKYKYKWAADYYELIKIPESITCEIFKLEGCSDNGKQGYFFHASASGMIYFSDRELTENYFEEQKDEKGQLNLMGCTMVPASDKRTLE